ncbi:indole-3-acetic acid-induced protein arg7 [Phtheirospermum japonicum]|uniref:Indole-3-acetic acid-induced protein arg7 n=1 Tax=Phtheirospermum japonicum TaxID=374723 RepID=A0A830CJK9_9LAMI|nr:indole-3-acetic acid-induced protein arg7 [Phtheirospermum japonicum]
MLELRQETWVCERRWVAVGCPKRAFCGLRWRKSKQIYCPNLNPQHAPISELAPTC